MTEASTGRARTSLVEKFAAKYTIEPDKILPILKNTAFKVFNPSAVSKSSNVNVIVLVGRLV